MLGSLCDNIEIVLWISRKSDGHKSVFFLEARNSTICRVEDRFNISGWMLPFVFGLEPPKILGGPSLWRGPFQSCSCRAVNYPLIFLGRLTFTWTKEQNRNAADWDFKCFVTKRQLAGLTVCLVPIEGETCFLSFCSALASGLCLPMPVLRGPMGLLTPASAHSSRAAESRQGGCGHRLQLLSSSEVRW